MLHEQRSVSTVCLCQGNNLGCGWRGGGGGKGGGGVFGGGETGGGEGTGGGKGVVVGFKQGQNGRWIGYL